ncbi:MAG: type IIL restriction-modification enzyme MmeI, partial [Marinirhabdus sp.]|nr:type IIL restriction-modification enzyme MmeI [Marinirhabdus sp.]
LINQRVELCRQNRLKSKDAGGVKLADTPYKFRENWETSVLSIIVPRVFSENRDYVTAGIVDQNQIVSDSAFAIYDADLWLFALISSRLHFLWIKTVCGQLETRIRYSNTLGWHTFPCKGFNSAQVSLLEQSAKNILLARENHYPISIAELYKPDLMPSDLRQAHKENDALINNLYFGVNEIHEESALDLLFEKYVQSLQG